MKFCVYSTLKAYCSTAFHYDTYHVHRARSLPSTWCNIWLPNVPPLPSAEWSPFACTQYNIYEDAFTEEASLILSHFHTLALLGTALIECWELWRFHICSSLSCYIVSGLRHMHLLVTVEWKDSYSTRIKLWSCSNLQSSEFGGQHCSPMYAVS